MLTLGNGKGLILRHHWCVGLGANQFYHIIIPFHAKMLILDNPAKAWIMVNANVFLHSRFLQ